ncbi:hypothetical protein [Cupriavidus sp. UYPR2.512]|uniref:hypothetical protein n=1 Tax=Cupriavidus sp. UYPR2.512 TaxID=1080187 RepID=UPI000361E15D|nr:hypothetical protein [Cupriavidus sp. UYPR2.512]UIF88478.1 hypothetical protein KAF44_24150 [Cupriavidus necator]
MVPLRSVNWWPENLRLYESRLSFLARFCALNGLNARSSMKFLNVNPEDDTPLSEEALVRLSSVPHEPLLHVQRVFSQSASFVGCGRYAPPPAMPDPHRIRYCKACSRHGYHSYLHETNWLSRCPFHLTPLETAEIAPRSGTTAALKVETWQRLIQASRETWPHYRDDGFPTQEHGQMASLTAWLTRAGQAAARLAQAERWRSRDRPFFGTPSLAQVFGQLRTLEAMPAQIEPLFTELGSNWCVERRAFPWSTRCELDRLQQRGLGLDHLLDFYRRVESPSALSPLARIRAAQDRLKATTAHGSRLAGSAFRRSKGCAAVSPVRSRSHSPSSNAAGSSLAQTYPETSPSGNGGAS